MIVNVFPLPGPAMISAGPDRCFNAFNCWLLGSLKKHDTFPDSAYGFFLAEKLHDLGGPGRRHLLS